MCSSHILSQCISKLPIEAQTFGFHFLFTLPTQEKGYSTHFIHMLPLYAQLDLTALEIHFQRANVPKNQLKILCENHRLPSLLHKSQWNTGLAAQGCTF